MSLAYVFPGQGAQSVGMLAELAASYPVVIETFAEASAALGYDLWRLCQDGPGEQLSQTQVTQPALLASGVAVYRVWQGAGGAPAQMMAGHSLGEYTALVCCGALAFSTAVRLVEFRGNAMQDAVPAGTGAMAAILGLDDDQVISACKQGANSDCVAAVNFNSPGQVVIAGKAAAVRRAIEIAKQMGARKAIPLPVSVPSHCALMASAAEKLERRLSETEFAASNIPVVHNVDAKTHETAGDIREALVRQLYLPVRWVECVQYMSREGIGSMLEFGPGKVLTGLNRRIDKSMTIMPVFDPASLDAALGKMTAETGDE